jgi:hypothetical protein
MHLESFIYIATVSCCSRVAFPFWGDEEQHAAAILLSQGSQNTLQQEMRI